MNRNERVTIRIIILFIISTILICMLYVYNSKQLSSGFLTADEVKKIDESVWSDNLMLSYGPGHKMPDSAQLVILKYDTDTNGNWCEVYSDENGVNRTRQLNKNNHFLLEVVKEPEVHLQILTYFGGEGELTINGIGVIPVWLAVLWLVCVMILFAFGVVPKSIETIPNIVKCLPYFILFVGNVYYADCSHNKVQYGWVLSVLLIVGIVTMTAFVFCRIDKNMLRFILSVVAIWFLEWRNICHYEYDYMTLYLTECVTICLMLLIYLLCEHMRLYNILLIAFTTVFGIYSTIQYIYYMYFRDFFSVKIIKLLSTALGASASITELLTVKVFSYILILVLYYVSFWAIGMIKCWRNIDMAKAEIP